MKGQIERKEEKGKKGNSFIDPGRGVVSFFSASFTDSLKGMYMVARLFFLLLLNCSAWLLLSKTYTPFSSPLYMIESD